MDYKRIDYLIKQLKKGRQEYFDEFYALTKSAVFYIIKKYNYSDDFVKDVMQETYVSFLNNMQNIKVEQNPISYLLTIAKNKAIDMLRKDNKYVTDFEDLENMETKQDSTFVDYPLLYYAKQNLTNDEFFILEQTVILGYKRVEVAKMLDKPIATVNWQYNKILKKVKNFYKEVYNEKV